MGDRRRDGDEGAGAGDGRGARPSFPLLFEEERPSLLRRMARPLKDLLPGEADTPAPAFEPPAEVAVPPEAEGPVAPDDAPAPEPPAETLAGPVHRLTLQLLPGRLQPLDHQVIRQEVRFLRSGPREAEVTLGWAEGEPPRHVTLDHPSLQPMHARMRFHDGRWSIESLSPRDPVWVNGAALPVGAEPHALEGGEHVRMGDVEFRFLWP